MKINTIIILLVLAGVVTFGFQKAAPVVDRWLDDNQRQIETIR